MTVSDVFPDDCLAGRCPNPKVIEHEVKIQGLEEAVKTLQQIGLAILLGTCGTLATSLGCLAFLYFNHK
jgi:hypothetical protein